MARILSLDILAGVFCGYTFASIILESKGPPLTPLILCLTVWLIYTLDHLMDANSLKEKSARPAYRWHYMNRKILWPVLIVAGFANAVLSLVYLSPRILVFGCIMGGLVVFYTLFHQKMMGSGLTYLFKEGWISTIYTAGIWGIPLLSSERAPGIPVVLIIIIYLLLVLINVLVYSFYAYHTDDRESQRTLATVAGRETTAQLLRLLILSVLMLVMAAFLTLDDPAMGKVYTILLFMTAIMGCIVAYPRFFRKNERYGILADGVFFLPVLLLWMR